MILRKPLVCLLILQSARLYNDGVESIIKEDTLELLRFLREVFHSGTLVFPLLVKNYLYITRWGWLIELFRGLGIGA